MCDFPFNLKREKLFCNPLKYFVDSAYFGAYHEKLKNVISIYKYIML